MERLNTSPITVLHGTDWSITKTCRRGAPEIWRQVLDLSLMQCAVQANSVIYTHLDIFFKQNNESCGATAWRHDINCLWYTYAHMRRVSRQSPVYTDKGARRPWLDGEKSDVNGERRRNPARHAKEINTTLMGYSTLCLLQDLRSSGAFVHHLQIRNCQ